MKKKAGFFLPEPILDAFEAAAGEIVHGKEKWLVAVAAIVLFLEQHEDQRAALIRRVRSESGKDGDFGRLVEAAKVAAYDNRPIIEAPVIRSPGLPPELPKPNGTGRGKARDRAARRTTQGKAR